MRPARFQDFSLDLVKNSPGVTRVQSLGEAGDTTHPFGLAITTTAGEVRWQIIGQLATGEKHDDQDTPVNGDPVPAEGGEPDPSDHEGWLYAALVRAESPEIASIARWSTREDAGKSRGLTLDFHNSARVFIRQL
ncbi:hypothetical protein [Streptomyces corynorhini]|uniref:Uncharacterized protein n=1 Tax=Streptomyces corynorhini TaxID=2282652 RepID=A0A370AYQ3_9ACTN|nr:hypothetical protein [Streptomyces corynorhini]RDG32596.1 hypothetical protein DVH02_32335 [Streptomyces corynorhini]